MGMSFGTLGEGVYLRQRWEGIHHHSLNLNSSNTSHGGVGCVGDSGDMWKLWAATLDSPVTLVGFSEHGEQCAHHVALGSGERAGPSSLHSGSAASGSRQPSGGVPVCHGALGSEPGQLTGYRVEFPCFLEKGTWGAPPNSFPSSPSPTRGPTTFLP